MIRAVFLDVDGTVFSHTTGSIPPSALKAINQLREKGILVFGATGRHIWEIRHMNMKEFQPDGWVYVNGAYCCDKQGVYYSVPLDQNDLSIIAYGAEELGFPCLFMTKDTIYCNMDNEMIRKEQEIIHTPMPPIKSTEEILQEEIYMLVPYAEADVWDPLFAKTETLKYTRWTPLAMDVFDRRTDKAEGIRRTLQRYELSKEEVLAVGDGPNDLSMKEACGLLCAMGNANDELKKAADYVTEHIDRDGLVRAFEHFGLLEEER